jgi:hypothetical protein
MAMNNNTEGRRVQADNGRMFESFMGGDDFEMQQALPQMALAKKVRGTNQARCFSLVMINSGSAGLPFTAWRERTSWLFAAAHDEALGTAGGWAQTPCRNFHHTVNPIRPNVSRNFYSPETNL